ncbi:MAG: ATP-binding protein, partial [Chthoniobacteraceae bacterium]
MTDAPSNSASPSPSPASRPGSRLTHDVPWPGLAAYWEADRDFFFGRSRETAELLRIVRRDPFVLLTGAAGVGKTSLLLAGVFPVLREEGFLPVRIRLDWTDSTDERPLSVQVLECLTTAAKSEGVDGGTIAENDSLWEAFHRAGQRWWNARQQVVVPVLVIDQAEELFTHGRATLRRRQRTDRLIEELAQLVENRAPARVATLLEKSEQKPDAFSFEAAPVRIVLSVREESLSHVRPLRGVFPSMGRSEQRLLPFSTSQAREAIAKPSAQNDLLTEGTADAIVRFLADGSGSETPVFPTHLSILGRELALARQQKGSGQISTDALQSSPS